MTIKVLMGIALLMVPLAGYHVIIGATTGLLQSIAILLPLSKSPRLLQKVVGSNPLTADLAFSGLAAWGTSTFFGTGLMLAVATATTAIILSITLPKFGS